MEIKTDFQFEAFCKIVKNIPFYKDHKERPCLFFEGLIFLEQKYNVYIQEYYGYHDFYLYIQIVNDSMEIIRSFKYDAFITIDIILTDLSDFLSNREKEYNSLLSFTESLSELLNCPNCGAPINKDKDKCEYCDTFYNVRRR